ncbi:MAG TPA: DUF763 domain-containing protein [Coriobacteriia bacterium]|jgi:hypothetical protein
MRTGTATLPLHGGKAPAWLFQRMRLLAREITLVVVSEFGPGEMLRRLSDPVWFQAFGCVLGFDWHSSGVTTTVCGALKDGLAGLEHESGLVFAGGKGGTSRKTPSELREAGERVLRCDPEPLVYASKMAAKVDSSGLQDGYQIYHHSFMTTLDGRWAVVQQGMRDADGTARRYHWLGEGVSDFVVEPHAAVAAEASPSAEVLNLVATESGGARDVVARVARETPEHVAAQLARLKSLRLPRHHEVRLADIRPENLEKAFLATYERQPAGFEELLAVPGVGPKTVRALTLISELVYDAPASRRDPAVFSYAHGGKDGYPYPVDRATYDRDIGILHDALGAAKVGRSEKLDAFKRLSRLERAAG